MDLSAGVRRASLGRRRYHSLADHFSHRSGPLRLQEVQHPVRCHWEEMGSICCLGFSRQRRLYAAGALEVAIHQRLSWVRRKISPPEATTDEFVSSSSALVASNSNVGLAR